MWSPDMTHFMITPYDLEQALSDSHNMKTNRANVSCR